MFPIDAFRATLRKAVTILHKHSIRLLLAPVIDERTFARGQQEHSEPITIGIGNPLFFQHSREEGLGHVLSLVGMGGPTTNVGVNRQPIALA